MADTPAASHAETGKKVTDAERENMREAQIHFVYSVCIMGMLKDLAFYFSHREFTLLQEIETRAKVRR
jgi:hypothetical protein